jgi:hypothetical protein
MTRKKWIMSVVSLSCAGTLYFFITTLLKVFGFFKNPLEFSFGTLFYLMLFTVLLFGHMVAYVHFMDTKPKVSDIQDIDEWWTKWDRV